MTFCRSVLATLTVCALALSGCTKDTAAKPTSKDDGVVGSIAARLTLPDDSEIDSVHWHITGPMYDDSGDVPVGDSTILTFRIGGLPVQDGYNIELSATTSYGNDCLGSAMFDIMDNQVSTVAVTLQCGATDDKGDIIVNGDFESCPVITAISAIPGEITLGHDISLLAEISHGNNPVHWSGMGGTFGSPDAYATAFTCDEAGSWTLTVAVNTADCTDARTVDVICTLGAGCGNGVEEVGEGCDDGNTVETDACLNNCHDAVCGDNQIQAGVELCDGGNNVPGDGCGATCQTEVCGNNIIDTAAGETCDDNNTTSGDGCSATCHLEGCGDGVIQPATENCEDMPGNNVTETCAYGDQDGCTVCDSTCHSVAGATAFCGDTIVNGTEQCDAGPAGSAVCSTSCTTIVPLTACQTCRNTNCIAYQGGTNTVAGCFDAGAPGATARAARTAQVFSPAQVQTCVDAINCAESMHCGHDVGRAAAACYCGSLYLNNGDCAAAPNTGATAPNGVCKAQFTAAAAPLTSNSDIMANLSSFDFPMGWAYRLLQCETTFCPTECMNP